MPIEPGQTLLHYRIVDKLGEGGMGVVWRARDTTLDREVAIKVLPEHLAGDAERLARFEREAKLLASLSHPGIAIVHGLHPSTSSGHFLAMELVPGEDLSRRLARGPLPLDETLQIAGELAAALEAAHERGVIHRDLKPANIQLTPEGSIKVLDFGLAKALSPSEAAAGSEGGSPTITSAGTAVGTILGTASYMSPEQARAKPLDRRTDVWAFGCVLFEMLTGARPFPGDTAAEVLGAVLHKEPDLSLLPVATPAPVRRLLERCLRKKPKERLRSMGDAGLEIADAAEGRTYEDPLALELAKPQSAKKTLLIWAVTIAAIALLYYFQRDTSSPTPPPPLVRTSIQLPEGLNLQSHFAISSDGRRVAYAAGTHESNARLFVRDLDRFEAREIEGSEGVWNPFFSPDDRWIGFHTEGKLNKVPAEGGAPVKICDCSAIFGAAWLPDDTIVFGPGLGSGLSSVSADGGEVTTLTTPDAALGEVSHGRPRPLRDGKRLLFTIGTGDGSYIAVLERDDGTWSRLQEGSAVAHLPDGRLAFTKGDTLFTAPLHRSRLETTAAAVPALHQVSLRNTGGLERSRVAISDQGTLVYAVGDEIGAVHRLVITERDGSSRTLDLEQLRALHPRVSPDGRRLACTGVNPERGSGDIWVVDIERGTGTRLTVEGANYTPLWSPDGKRIAYVSNGNIAWKAADGSGAPEVLLAQEPYQRPTSFSRKGDLLAFVSGHWDAGDIGVLSREDGTVELEATPFNEMDPTFSPDGRFLSYVSNESGRYEVYVRAYPGPGGKWLVSTDGGKWPTWSEDSSELFFRNGDEFLEVSVGEGDAPSFGTPELVFEGEYHLQTMVPNFDAWGDGERFVTVEALRPEIRELLVVQGWFGELGAIAE